MNPFLLALILVALLSAAGFAGAGSLRKAREDSRTSALKLGSMSRDEVLRMLSRVEKFEEPEPIMGAMCYEPVCMPSVLEYVCPVCGGKTVYGYDYSSSFYALQDIASARQTFAGLDSVSELEMSLDESAFCSTCRSDSTGDPALVLRIVWDDGSTHEAPVSLEDLRMLTGFLSGGLEYSTSNDGTVPLKTGLDRLRELLGI